ncbi:MAG: glutamate racemase [Myxococcales bacterium]|nr:glutamate racemase [Myxococcales bacterium]
MARPRGAPLGVFDSGLGGLTVVRALLDEVPGERIVYLGDTARVPYGTRSAETVIRYARGCARVLTDRGVKALVVACNTVSAVALDMLRAELDMPVIGVVEPGARAAVLAAEAVARARSEESDAPPPRIGVLGTQGTIASNAYPRAVQQRSTRFEVVGRAAPLLVPLVEEGWLDGEVPELAVQRYVEPLLAEGAGVLVLGCTHYPLLQPVVERVARRLAGRPVPVVDSATATARSVAELLEDGRIAARVPPREESHAERLQLLVTDLPGGFQRVAELFLGEHTPQAEQIDLNALPSDASVTASDAELCPG